MSGAAPRTYSGGSTSMSNSLPQGMNRRWKPARSCMIAGSSHQPAERVNLGRHRAEIRDNKVRCTPFLVVFGSRTR
jgi:hypothetical protein